MIVTEYSRYSPRPDEETSLSNESQFDMQDEWLLKHSLPLPRPGHRFGDEAKSRDDMTRAGLWEAAKACQRGLFVAYSLDRIGDVLAIETVVRLLERQRSRLATVVEGFQENDPDSELMRILRGGLSRNQKRKGAENTSRHMLQRQANGERMSRYPPVGKRFRQIGIKHKSIGGVLVEVPHCIIEDEPDEHRIIAQIKQTSERLGRKDCTVSRLLRAQGITFRGKPLSRKVVALAMAYNGPLILTEPDIDPLPLEILPDAVQARLRENHQPASAT